MEHLLILKLIELEKRWTEEIAPPEIIHQRTCYPLCRCYFIIAEAGLNLNKLGCSIS